MKEYLVYWKYYWDDTEGDAPGQFRWASANERFYDAIEPGDALWVVIRGGPDHPGEWRLLERNVVSQKSIDTDGDDGYGRFTFEGDADTSERFRPGEFPDFTPVLQSLQFSTGKRIELQGSLIGRALQSPRRLADDDPGPHPALPCWCRLGRLSARRLTIIGVSHRPAPQDRRHT